jgi:hypothetical protein
MEPNRRIEFLFACCVMLAATMPVSAESLPDSTADDRTSVAVTVYNVNLALVRETRNLAVPSKGESTLRFMDVPSAINPRTVHLKSLTAPGALTVLEQNYEYDLISPAKLMEKYVGREVELIEQADDLTTRTVTAKLLSVNGGPVYQIGDRIVLNQTGKVTLASVPPDLVPRPTLVWTLGAEQKGDHEVEASYLTDNMNWSADYVAVVDADDRQTDITGWVTIDNRSGATYRDATLKLVAGDVRRITPQVDRMVQYEAMALKRAAAPQFEEEAFLKGRRDSGIRQLGRRGPGHPAAQGYGPRLQERPLRSGAVRRRRCHRPHAAGRDDQPARRRRLRRRGRPDANRLPQAQSAPGRGGLRGLDPQPQGRSRHRDRA